MYTQNHIVDDVPGYENNFPVRMIAGRKIAMRLKTLNREIREFAVREGEYEVGRWVRVYEIQLWRERLRWEWGWEFTKWGWEGNDCDEGEREFMKWGRVRVYRFIEWGTWRLRGTFPRVKLVYFRILKEGKTKTKNFGKEEGYGGNEKWDKFYFEDYGGSKCHISKEHYGAYEVVVLYS